MCVIDCSNTIYEVGGGDIILDFHMTTASGVVFSGQGCSARIAIADWIYRTTPIYQCNGTIIKDGNGIYSIASFKIPGVDTVNMNGAYVYQVSIKDVNGNLEPPFQGKLIIAPSADKSFVQGG